MSADPPPVRLPIVGVLGSGSEEHVERAGPLGRWLAGLGVHLLTGGGRGVMASVSRAFHEVRPRAGRVIGVLPGNSDGSSPAGYPNPWVEIPIRTHLPWSGDRGTDPLSRNHINVLSPDLLIALPGSAGTSSEVRLALRYGRTVAAFLEDRDEIPELAAGVPVFEDLPALKGWIGGELDRLELDG